MSLSDTYMNETKNKEYYHNLQDREGILRLHKSEQMANIFTVNAKYEKDLLSFITHFLPTYTFFSSVNTLLSSQADEFIYGKWLQTYPEMKNLPDDPEASSEEGVAKAYWAGFILQDYAYDGLSGTEILQKIDIKILLDSFEACRNLSMPDMKEYIKTHCSKEEYEHEL